MKKPLSGFNFLLLSVHRAKLKFNYFSYMQMTNVFWIRDILLNKTEKKK